MLPGQIIRNRYKIIRALGSGSFGNTYLAEDLDLPDYPLCVVKNLRQSPSQEELQVFINFFSKEAKALYRLGREYSQIPQLFAHFEEGGEFYLVQEYIDGHDLSQEIFSGNRLSEAKVAQLLKEVLEVLKIVHDTNIIHRDIKAQNLMRRNSDGKIVLIDFGAVKEISKLNVNPQELTDVTSVVGTSGYMPNEQLNGYPKLCSDVYAVGMLGIYALTGIRPQELPKDPNTFEVIWRDRVSVSPNLTNVLDKMVRSNFKERYQTAGEALQALTTPSSKHIRLIPPHSSSILPANQRLLIGAGVVVSLLFGIGLLFITSRQPTTDVGHIPDSEQRTPNLGQATLIPAQPISDPEACPKKLVSSTLTTPPDWEHLNNKYYGELKTGQFNGCGIFFFANGNKYEGRFKKGKFHGKGTYTFKNGNRYIGQFNNNFYQGMGQLLYNNGCQYIGEFKQNKFDGQGTCTSPNGISESGIWHQGKLAGGNQTCCN